MTFLPGQRPPQPAQAAGRAVLPAGADGRHLRHGAAPNLPDFYNQAIDGVAIGEGVGSCGTAAQRRQQVIVTDIATDPRWDDVRDLAGRAGLAACWSTPILARDGSLQGTFGIYHRVPRAPQKADFRAHPRLRRHRRLSQGTPLHSARCPSRSTYQDTSDT
jgi:GAF domain-containing protein